MASKPKPASIETESRPVAVVKGRRIVRLRGGQRSNVAICGHATYRLLRAYSSGLIDKRTVLGRFIRDREDRYARHRGFPRFDDCPVTLQAAIGLVIRQLLFQMTFEPAPDSRTGGREIGRSENTLTRLLIEFGLEPAQKTIPDLQGYLAALEAEEKQNA